jgi:hypothetical protein
LTGFGPDAREGEVGMEGFRIGALGVGGGGAVNAGLEFRQFLEIAGEADPEDARAMGIGEGAEGTQSEVQRGGC